MQNLYRVYRALDGTWMEIDQSEDRILISINM
jgi:hypothetical protein